MSSQFGRHPAECRRADDSGGHEPGDRHRHGEPVDAVDVVTHPLSEQDVDAPADRGAERERYAHRIDRSRPRLGEQHHADRGEQRPQVPTAGPGGRDRHAERAEEFQRARGTQRDAVERGHEQHRDSGGDDAERHTRREGAPGERRRTRTHDDQQQHTRPQQVAARPRPRRRCGRSTTPTQPAPPARTASTRLPSSFRSGRCNRCIPGIEVRRHRSCPRVFPGHNVRDS